MKRLWIKLYVEMLDDPKIGTLPAWLKWRFVELLLVAAEGDEAGMLPSVTQLAWRLRVEKDDLVKSLRALSEIGVVCESGDRWKVTNFEKRQYSESLERVRRYRNAKSNGESNANVTDNESISYSSLDSNSLDEEGTGGENKPKLDLFVGYFGKFQSEKEIKRWLTLFDAVGKDQAEQIAQWATKKEIHLENRPGLLDSMETAAKNWQAKPPKGGQTTKQTPAPSSWLKRKEQELAQNV